MGNLKRVRRSSPGIKSERGPRLKDEEPEVVTELQGRVPGEVQIINRRLLKLEGGMRERSACNKSSSATDVFLTSHKRLAMHRRPIPLWLAPDSSFVH